MARPKVVISMICWLVACAAGARADLSLSVDVGWGGYYRIGRWSPIYVTLSDTTARPVILEVLSPHSRGFGVQIRMGLSVSPAPATYVVYVPLSQSLGELSLVVRDARTERRLVQWPPLDQRDSMLMMGEGAVDVLVGTSGRGPTMRSIGGQTRAGQVRTAFTEPLKLPSHPAGLDSLDVLVLNQPDLNRLAPEQQQAITDWVRGGGNLLLWPGEDPIPAASPLVAALPCLIGENVALAVEPEVLSTFGLAPRFGNLRGRELLPKPGAERVPALGATGPLAWRGRVGFGLILVLPFDPTFLVFRDDQTANRFWQPLLEGMVDLRPLPEQGGSPYYYWNDPFLRQRSAAFTRVADLLGNVPGVGQFGFAYVAIVLIGLMIIVGPVDWLVLKYLGRQPWTWATTTGWIVLVTVGALFVGSLFKSGDLHFRTLRVVDQADGQVVAATDFIGLYSPRTRFYEFTVERDSWWQPGADYIYGHGGALRSDLPFAQDAISNRPAPMLINVWNLRFLQGETHLSAPAVIESSLAIRADAQGRPMFFGTLTNRSNQALRNLKIRSAPPDAPDGDGLDGTWNVVTGSDIDRIEPGQTVTVELPIVSTTMVRSVDSPGQLWAYAGDLEIERTKAIGRLLAEYDDLVCIYAEVEDPQPAVSIGSERANQKHWQIVRALVPVVRGEQR